MTIARILSVALAAAVPQQAVMGACSPATGNVDCSGDLHAGVHSGVEFTWATRLVVHDVTVEIKPSNSDAAIRSLIGSGLDAVVIVGSPTDRPSVTTTAASSQGIYVSATGIPATPSADLKDPFLNVFVVAPVSGATAGSGATVVGGRAIVENHGSVETWGAAAHGIHAFSNSAGYGSAVTNPLVNFDITDFQFAVTSVTGLDGSVGAVGSSVDGLLVDRDGNPVLDAQGEVIVAGTFTIDANGHFTFTRNAYVDTLHLEEGEFVQVAVDYTVHGSRDGGAALRDDAARLVMTVRGTHDGSLEQLGETRFAQYGVGDTTWPARVANDPKQAATVFPDLPGFIEFQLARAGSGSGGGVVSIDNQGTVVTHGDNAYGLYGETVGNTGAHGIDGTISHSAGGGGTGQNGGTVFVTAGGDIETHGVGSLGVLAFSRGGTGGHGGDGGTWRYGQPGGAGGRGGDIVVDGDGLIHTRLDDASGILAASVGGYGGDGGSGDFATGGDRGGAGGASGTVHVDGSWSIYTEGNNAYGIWAKSTGGNAGAGGSGGWLWGDNGSGGLGSDGGNLFVRSGGDIVTLGKEAYGIHAQSVGGFGGSGGGGFSLFYSAGGSGSSAGSGGSVEVVQTETGSIQTSGVNAHGILAQSVGGGGGSGGDTSGFIAAGGDSGAGGHGGEVRVTNAGTIVTGAADHYTGAVDAYGIFAQSVGGGGGEGGAAKGAGSVGGDGSGGGHGSLVVVQNLAGGQISATGQGSIGIFAQSVGGGGGSGGSSGGVVAIGGKGSSTSAGGDVRVNNRGIIDAASTGLFAQSIGGGGGNGGSSSGWFSFGGKGGGGGNGGAVTVDTSGLVHTRENNAAGVFAQSVGGGGGNGGNAVAVGAIAAVAMGGEGAKGGTGGAVVVTAGEGFIRTDGDRSSGVFAQSVGGGGGNGGFAFAGSVGPVASVSVALGGKAGGGNSASSVQLDSRSDINTHGDDSHGIAAQSVGGGGGTGGFSIALAASDVLAASFAMGGKGGTGGDASTVTLGGEDHWLTGTITTEGAHSYGILAQSIGGGGGDGGFSVAGAVSGTASGSLSFGGAGNTGGNGKAVTVWSSTGIRTLGADSHGLFAQSVGGGGGSGGFSVAGTLSGSIGLGVSLGGAGGGGASSSTVVVHATGPVILTDGRHSYGVLAQSVGGSGGDGGFSVSAGASSTADLKFGLGGSGGKGGGAGNVTLASSTWVYTRGDDAHALFAQSLGGGGGTGGFSIAGGVAATAAIGIGIGGAGGEGGNAGDVTLSTDHSEIRTEGVRSFGALAQSIGGSGGNGGFSLAGGISNSASVSFAMGGSGGKSSVGGNVTLLSSSDVTTLGADSHGLFAQSVGGSGGSGGFAITGGIAASGAQIGVGIGGAGGAGSQSNHTVLTTTGGRISTAGARSYGIVAQSVGGSGGDGGFSVTGGISRSASINFGMGGRGASGGIGGAVDLTSASDVHTSGVSSHGLFAQSVGGGGGSGGFSIVGGISAGNANVNVGIGGNAGKGGNSSAVHLTSTGAAVITEGERAFGLFAQSIGGGGGDGGSAITGGAGNGLNVTFGMGGRAGAGGNAELVGVVNSSDVITLGDAAHALVAQSVGGGGGSGGLAMTGSLAGGPQSRDISVGIGGDGGAGGNGGAVDVLHQGIIETFGERAYGVLIQSIGGGGGDGGLAKVVNKVEDYKAPELPSEPDDPDKDKPKTVSFGITVGAGGDGGAAGDAKLVHLSSTGNITTHGVGSHAVFVQSIGGGGGAGGMSATDGTGGNGDISVEVGVSLGGRGGKGGSADAVNVESTGLISTDGAGAHGIFAQSIGGGGGNGGASVSATEGGGDDARVSVSVNAAIGGSGGVAGDGKKVTIDNDGSIVTRGVASYGVLAQSIGGGGGDGGQSTVTIGKEDEDEDADSGDASSPPGEPEPEKWSVSVGIGASGDGGTAGTGGAVEVTSDGSVTTWGTRSHALMAQSIGGGGGVGGASSADTSGGKGDVAIGFGLALGGSGGSGGSASRVDVTKTGTLVTLGDGAHGIAAQSIGGGGGNGGGSLTTGGGDQPDEQLSVNLSLAIGGSGALGGNGGLVFVTNHGSILTEGYGAYAVMAQSIGGGGGEGGLGSALPAKEVQSTLDLRVAIGGGGGGGGHGSAVDIQSTGTTLTLGDDAIAVFAQSIGGGGGAGGASIATGGQASWGALSVGIGGSGGTGNYGDTVTILNTGDIGTRGAGAHAVLAQSIGGGGGRGGNAQSLDLANVQGGSSVQLGVSVGGSGAGASEGRRVSVTNIGNIFTEGAGAFGALAQSIGGGGGEGGYGGSSGTKADGTAPGIDLQLTLGGGAGSGGQGGAVMFSETGSIQTRGSAAAGVLLQSIGGGGGVGGYGLSTTTGSLSIGGAGGAGGNGGDVTFTLDGAIDTSGASAYGVIAQSIGGGGGAAGNVSAGLSLSQGFGLGLAIGRKGGAGGDGGIVQVSTTGDVVTRGDGAVGIFAQSVGGGGGLVGQAAGTLPFAGSVGGAGSGGEVNVTHTGHVATLGNGSHGVVAQSAGGLGSGGDVHVTIDGSVYTAGTDAIGLVLQSRGDAGNGSLSLELGASGAIVGGSGTGSAVALLDGRDNSVLNRGTITTVDDVAGMAIVGSSHDDTVNNLGWLIGSLDLGSGDNVIDNTSGGVLLTGARIDIGTGGLLTNAGTLAPGGFGHVQTTVVDGNLVNTGTAIQWFDIDMARGLSDQLVINGDYTADGIVNLLFVSPVKAVLQNYELVDVNGTTIDAGMEVAMPGAPAVFTATLSQQDGNTWLELRPDFSIGGDATGSTGTVLGGYLNAIMEKGASPAMQALLDSLATLPSRTAVGEAIRELEPTPYTAVPTTALQSQLRFNDAMMSCRALDGDHRFARETSCAWARATTWTSSHEGTAWSADYELQTNEASAGVQQAVGADAHWVLGIGLSYEDQETTGRQSWASNGSLTQFGGVVKGQFGPFTMALSAGYGTGSQDTRRPVPMLGDAMIARSQQDVTSYSGDLRLAYDFERTDWYLRPLLDVNYANVRIDAFHEEGAGVANLVVGQQSDDYTAIRPAVEIGRELRLESGSALRPFARVGATQVVSGAHHTMAAGFEQAPDGVAPFLTETRDDESYGDVLFGLDLVRAKGLSFRFTYGAQLSAHTNTYATGLKLWVPIP